MLLQPQTLIPHLLIIDFHYSIGIFRVIIFFVWLLLNIYLVAVEIRFLIQWCLNVNPYYEPYVDLWNLTNPVFIFGRRLYPKVLGIDLAPLVNFKILSIVIDAAEQIAFDRY
jgi:uncharacterized protein YggT (Ycf19 family)